MAELRWADLKLWKCCPLPCVLISQGVQKEREDWNESGKNMFALQVFDVLFMTGRRREMCNDNNVNEICH